MARKQKQVNFNDDTDVYLGKSVEDYEELEVAEEAPKTYNTIKLVNNVSARIKIPGAVTGELYIWERAGAVVDVDERDAPGLLAKTLGSGRCCGSANKNVIFEIFKE